MVLPPGCREDGPGARDAFRTQVLPLLERYCIDCHSTESPEAGIVLDRFEDQAAAVKDGQTWLRVRDALEGHVMPPADEPQPSPEERDRDHGVGRERLSGRPVRPAGRAPPRS